ncbi:MAG: hypothetical protein WCH74_13745 [Chloroflexota bacterium]
MAQSLAPLTLREVAAVLAAAGQGRRPSLDRWLVALVLDTGARRGEISTVTPCPEDPARVVSVGAGPSERLVRLGAEASDALASLSGPGRCAATDRALSMYGGTVPTDGGLHERILQVGLRAGVGGSLTVRRLRRTWLATVLHQDRYDDGIVATLADHHPEGIVRASVADALAAQFDPDWTSPLDALVAARQVRRAA